MSYRVWKICGLIFMALIGAWTVPALSIKMGFNTPLNIGIAVCGVGMMILSSWLESKGEI